MVFTQIAVIQDLIKEKDDLAKMVGDLKDDVLGRIGRLEKQEKEGQPSGPIEALQKVAEGLMAP